MAPGSIFTHPPRLQFSISQESRAFSFLLVEAVVSETQSENGQASSRSRQLSRCIFLESNNVLPLRRSSNVNKVFGACAVPGSFAANHTDLSARARDLYARCLCLSFPRARLFLPSSSFIHLPPSPSKQAYAWSPSSSHPRRLSFSRQRGVGRGEKRLSLSLSLPSLPLRALLRSVAGEVGPLLPSMPPRPSATHGAVMATRPAMGVAAREATPMHDGEARSIP